jgi:hypothetical protein
MPRRSTEEIRSSIESNRAQLELSMVRLRGEVAQLTDWRRQLARHRREALVGAALAGVVLGALLIPRRRRS